MKILAFVAASISVTMAQARFVPTHPGPNTPVKPILGIVNGGLADTANQMSIESLYHYQVYVDSGYMQIMGPGVEGSWYLRYVVSGVDFDSEVDSDSGDQKVGFGFRYDGILAVLDSGIAAPIRVGEFMARNWGMVGGDIGGAAYDPQNLSYLKNTANVNDTIDVRMVVRYWYFDIAADTKKFDTAYLDFGLEYHRGQLIPGLGIKGKTKSTLQAVSGGWKVPTGGRWTLRNLQGREIPMRQESTNDGVMLLPQGLRGVGVLTGPNGQSSKVHSLGGN